MHLVAEDVAEGPDEDSIEGDPHQSVEHANDSTVVRGRRLMSVTCNISFQLAIIDTFQLSRNSSSSDL